MASTALFIPALESIDGLVPHDGILTPDELERVAADIAER